MQKQPGGEKLVAFTRILHRQKGDVLMDEVRRTLKSQTDSRVGNDLLQPAVL